MNLSEFLRIERESRDGSKHYVLHTHDPKFAMELARTRGNYVGIGGSILADESRFEWTDGTVFYENDAPVPSGFSRSPVSRSAPRRALHAR